MPNPQKTEAVAEMTKLFQDSNSYFVTDYQGLNVADITALRKNLRENKIKYLVAKNTLFKLAVQQAGVTGIEEHLIGPTAIAFTSDDVAVAAKILHDSYKDKELPRIKVFVVEGQIFEGEDIKRLADLPPKEVLLGLLVATVEAPFSQLVGALDGFFRELIGTLEALTEKKKSEE